MAQTGYTPIQLYYSATTTNVPLAGNLAAGELAINTADGKLFYKDSGGTVQVIATTSGASGTVTSVAVSGGSTGLTTSGGPITSSGTITLAGTLAVANGGTGLTSLGSAGQALVVNSGGTALEYGSAGVSTGKSIAMSMIFGF